VEAAAHAGGARGTLVGRFSEICFDALIESFLNDGPESDGEVAQRVLGLVGLQTGSEMLFEFDKEIFHLLHRGVPGDGQRVRVADRATLRLIVAITSFWASGLEACRYRGRDAVGRLGGGIWPPEGGCVDRQVNGRCTLRT